MTHYEEQPLKQTLNPSSDRGAAVHRLCYISVAAAEEQHYHMSVCMRGEEPAVLFSPSLRVSLPPLPSRRKPEGCKSAFRMSAMAAR